MTGIQQRRFRMVLCCALDTALPPRILVLGFVILNWLQKEFPIALGALVLGAPSRIVLAT